MGKEFDLDFTNSVETQEAVKADRTIEKAHLSGRTAEQLEERRKELAEMLYNPKNSGITVPEGMTPAKMKIELEIVANELAAIRDAEIAIEKAKEKDAAEQQRADDVFEKEAIQK